MRRQQIIDVARVGSLCAAWLALVGGIGWALGRGETFTAHASLTTADGVQASAPVTIVVHQWATQADQEALAAAVKSGGSAAARALLAAREDIGAIQLGGRMTAIKYAHVRLTEKGRLVTLVTAQPILFIGGGAPHPKPREGFDLGLVLLDLDQSGSGDGELAPAATVRVDAKDAVVIENYAAEVVRLVNVARQ